MAILKCVVSGCPMNNIFPYVMRDEATEQRLISGIIWKFIFCSAAPTQGLQKYIRNIKHPNTDPTQV